MILGVVRVRGCFYLSFFVPLFFVSAVSIDVLKLEVGSVAAALRVAWCMSMSP